jgi:hypothetical protein
MKWEKPKTYEHPYTFEERYLKKSRSSSELGSKRKELLVLQQMKSQSSNPQAVTSLTWTTKAVTVYQR